MRLFKQIESVMLDGTGDYFLIKFPYSEERKEEVKQGVTGASFTKLRGWRAPAGPEQAAALAALGFKFTPQAQQIAELSVKTAEKLMKLSKASDAHLEMPGFGKQPFPFQKAGITYALERKRVIIGDEMGLGKTIQGLGTAYAAGAFPMLIITPASNKFQWEEEFNACIPGKIATVASKKTDELLLMMSDVVITNYKQLIDIPAFTDETKKQVRLSPLGQKLLDRPFKAIILDEGHYIKNPKAARSMACMELKKIPTLDYRLVLTGTPMLNKPKEFYALLKFLDRIDEFGGYWTFVTQWCGMTEGKYGLEATKGFDTVPLNTKLRQTCYVRRRKKEVLKELPDKLRTTYQVEITNRKEYKQAEKELFNWVRDQVEKDKEFLATLDGLSEIERLEAIAERKSVKEASARRAEQIVRLNALKKVAGEGKLKAAKAWIDNFKESGEKLVIFAVNKFMLEALCEWYPTACKIISTMPGSERQAEVKRFQETDEQLMIGAMGTSAANSPAGIGHTLTRASNVLFLQLGWTSGHHDQCEDRCHRIGQDDNLTAHYLISKDTIEKVIAQGIEDKRAMSAATVDGLANVEEKTIFDNVMDWIMEEIEN